LLRRHVLGRADQRAFAGHRLFSSARSFTTAETEVEELHHRLASITTNQHEVVRLDVAMNDAGAVHRVEGREELKADREHLAEAHLR
jgi:hypothetical protein